MPSYGYTEDGTPYVAIGNDEPEAKEFIVHTKCENCGQVHYFDFWAMFRGEEIECEHCGHKTKAKRETWTGDGWEVRDD